MIRRLFYLIPFGFNLIAFSAMAGDATQGEKLVKQWCVTCHTDNEAGRGTDAAPSLDSLAKENEHSPEWVNAWLLDPHPPMPNLGLTKKEIDDIQAYLRSLSKEEGETAPDEPEEAPLNTRY